MIICHLYFGYYKVNNNYTNVLQISISKLEKMSKLKIYSFPNVSLKFL